MVHHLHDTPPSHYFMSPPGILTSHPVLNFKYCKFVSYCTSALYYCISVCYLRVRMPPTDTTHPHPFFFPLLYHPRSIPHLFNGFFSFYMQSFTCIKCIYSHFKPTFYTSPPPILSLPQLRYVLCHGCHLPHINHWPHQRYSSASCQTLLLYQFIHSRPLTTSHHILLHAISHQPINTSFYT